MKSIIVVSLVALAHAKCDWPSDIGVWYPKPGQIFGTVIMDLGITEQEIQLLNPKISIDRIYPEEPYNVTFRPSRSGTWTEGCPSSLRIPDTSILDPSNAGQETLVSTSTAAATDSVGSDDDNHDDDNHDDDNGRGGGSGGDEHSLQITHTIRKTVATGTSTTATYGSDLSSISTGIDSQSADVSYPSSTKNRDSGNESEGYPTPESISDMPTSAASKPSGTLSEDGEISASDTKWPGKADGSKTSGTAQSAGTSEKTPTISQDPEAKLPTASEDAVSSYATVDEELTGTPSLPDVSSTGVGSATTGAATENEQSLESTLATSSVLSSITGTTKPETAPSSTLSQTDASNDNETEKPSGASSNEERTTLPEDHSTQIHSAGSEKVESSTLTEASATTTTVSQAQELTGSSTDPSSTVPTEDISRETKFTNSNAASDQTVTSVHTTPTAASFATPFGDGSTKQTATGATGSSAETQTTLVTSPSKGTPKTTTTASPFSWNELRLATCLYDQDLIGHGQLNGDMVLGMIADFCDRPDIDSSMKYGDKCIEDSGKDKSRVDYKFKICPKNHCPNYGQNMKDPQGQGGYSCTYIFFERIWRFCNDKNHNGNGGSWDSGCLEYYLEIG
ncbi:hypothetical protein FPOAC2_13874 [Fusarium poae]|uniref:uncharacterized protein n=1 Tax=Fusarium poae TaxID=36050 RepID=UPI001D041E11|nr:uncharacterized protein FPOAC1_013677 [Fusarium poae]KAG8664339.1 hypothetical protein FPOAC1_013677 [Fusarium poae]